MKVSPFRSPTYLSSAAKRPHTPLSPEGGSNGAERGQQKPGRVAPGRQGRPKLANCIAEYPIETPPPGDCVHGQRVNTVPPWEQRAAPQHAELRRVVRPRHLRCPEVGGKPPVRFCGGSEHQSLPSANHICGLWHFLKNIWLTLWGVPLTLLLR